MLKVYMLVREEDTEEGFSSPFVLGAYSTMAKAERAMDRYESERRSTHGDAWWERQKLYVDVMTIDYDDWC